MTNQNYTEEQLKDIQEREKKALELLKELQLTPACFVYKQNIGNDSFIDVVRAYLQDVKYTETKTAEEKTA